jgi:hypothetical protein
MIVAAGKADAKEFFVILSQMQITDAKPRKVNEHRYMEPGCAVEVEMS